MEEKAQADYIPAFFGKNVQKYRKEAGLTQEQLSERLKISQKHLSIVETGIQFASASLIGRISKELGVSPAMLFGGSRNDINYEEVNAIVLIMQDILQNRMAGLETRLDRIEKLLQGK